ncbi:MAG: DHH family phosphoesterase [Candidatus Nomurabacteria bacterium]|nr:DHH family phosphoesterase [Candidatus Nomurabacteria bacterium]
MEMNKKEQYNKDFFEIFNNAKNIVITSHIGPDDDSIASVLSMYEILSQKNTDKNIKIFYTGPKIERYNIFRNFEKINFVNDMSENLTDVDLLIVLDGSQYARFSKFPELLKNVPKTITLDHHAGTPDEFSFSIIDSTMTSTAQLIYTIFENDFNLTKELAEIFLLGILADTGNFNYIKPHQSEIFIIVKRLVEVGEIYIDSFKSKYNSISANTFEIIKEFIKNTNYKTIPGWPPFQYSFVNEKFLTENKFNDEERTAGSHIYMGQYLRNISGYGWGFVVSIRENGSIRLSARSLPGVTNVRLLFERTNLGSGHDLASGGIMKAEDFQDVKKAIDWLLDWMSKNPPLLN